MTGRGKRIFRNVSFRAGEMARWVKAFAAQPEPGPWNRRKDGRGEQVLQSRLTTLYAMGHMPTQH